MGVFLKNQYYDQIFAQLSFLLSQKRQFLRNFSAKIFFKIITSVPDRDSLKVDSAGSYAARLDSGEKAEALKSVSNCAK
jgi:hypothetical protein